MMDYKEKLHSLIGKEVSGIIDRPIGSHHPKYDDIIYSVNYGHLNDYYAPDNEEQDVYYLGLDKPINIFKGIVIAIIERVNDIEDKLVVTPNGMNYTDEEIEELVKFQEKFFTHKIVR